MIMNQTSPFTKDLVLVGGGHSHVQVVRMLTMKKALRGIRVTLISDESGVCYSGMLPGCLAGLYRPDEMEMELRPLCAWAGIRFIRARVAGLDPAIQQVLFDDGRPPLAYDALSINIGSTPRGMDTPGVRGHAVPTRPLGLLLKRVHHFEENHCADGQPLRIVIVGGGAAGVELAFAMHSRWGDRFAPVGITLVESNSTLLTGHQPRVARITGQYLEAKGITCLTGLRVSGVDESGVHFEEHPSMPCDFLLWATGGAPARSLEAYEPGNQRDRLHPGSTHTTSHGSRQCIRGGRLHRIRIPAPAKSRACTRCGKARFWPGISMPSLRTGGWSPTNPRLRRLHC